MTVKRKSCITVQAGDSKRRAQVKNVNMGSLSVSNIQNGEIVHQACLLITGKCPAYENSAGDYISIKSTDNFNNATSCNWPVVEGRWKGLVLLACGQNDLNFDLCHAGGVSSSASLSIVYQPRLHIPPLHLVIMVAKDSPLLIDCPPAKYGAFTSTHSSLDAAIAKFRTTALTWQALIADDMREKGLGRRAFRLEEEWTADTLSLHGARGSGNGAAIMRNVPKVHIIRTDKTLAELRDPKCAQQNRHASQNQLLYKIFTQALKNHGTPFDSNCRPVIAGMILDSHFSIDQDLILGHAALGCHDADGISLGMFGSHLTYSWPRFLDEVIPCLTDETPPGDSVGNDNNECSTMARACCVGQGAFLHEVGHAFGADHTSEIMARGYSKDWVHNFYPRAPVSRHNAKWDLQDALKLMLKPHFRIPGDEPVTPEFVQAEVRIEASVDDEDDDSLTVSSTAGLARVVVESCENSRSKTYDLRSASPAYCTNFSITGLSVYDKSTPLKVSALGMNGKTKVVADAWRLLASRSRITKSYITVAGSSIKLGKKSVKAANFDDAERGNTTDWSVLLRKRDSNGFLVRASAIDLRVGGTFDGAVVYYTDGSQQNCGESDRRKFGGHLSEKRNIPEKARIVKVEIGERGGWGGLDGIRMTLDNGVGWGELNVGKDDRVAVLEPGADEKIIGFCGKSLPYVCEFGIILAPRDIEVPDSVYDMRELQNFKKGCDDDDDDNDDDGSDGNEDENEAGNEHDKEDENEDENDGHDGDSQMTVV